MLENINICKVLLTISKYPTKGLTIRDIARITKLSPPTVSKIIKNLQSKEIVVVEKEKNSYKVFGNLDSLSFRRIKRTINFYEILDLIEHIKKEILPSAIILFGSYIRGEDTEDSDVDIIILRPRIKKDLDLKNFEEKLARKIHIIISDDFDKIKHLLGLDFVVIGSIQ